LGNQLFQLAYLHTLAKKHKTSYQIPVWEYADMFTHEFPQSNIIIHSIPQRERSYTEDDIHYYGSDIDISGYFQNEKYFDREEIRELFTLKPELVSRVRAKYQTELAKRTIAVCVRRGDYVDNPNYYKLPPRYYIQALQRLDYKSHNLLFISDDPEWCRFHFQAFPNAYFPKGDEREHFILSTLTDAHILSNSTFHWWAAYLSQSRYIIQPKQLFDGPLLTQEGDVNFYVENDHFFEIFDYTQNRIDLTDVTITIPVKYDHADRRRNLDIVLKLIRANFDTNIILMEQGEGRFSDVAGVEYMKLEATEFHRTRMLNRMAAQAKTPIIINYDCDIVLPAAAILQAVEYLRSGEADFVYPYEHNSTDVISAMLNENKQADLAVYKDLKHQQWTSVRPTYGGIVLINREKFIESGGENENFISYGPEDVERYERWLKLGYGHRRVRGQIYHLMHHRGPDSSMTHPHYVGNVFALRKMREMRVDELKSYIKSWNNFSA
jgi:hypothetical protein